MDNNIITSASFFDAYEVKFFYKVDSELLLIEKALEINRLSGEENGDSIQSKISIVWSSLNQLIMMEKKEAEQTLSPNELKNFNEVFFIVVAMVDEFFLRQNKTISDYWGKKLFEVLYFTSRSSGETFFEKIDEVLQNKVEKKKSVLFTYLLAICLGFKGKYYGTENEKDLLHYKKALYGLIFNKNEYTFSYSNTPGVLSNLNTDDYAHNNKSYLSKNRRTYYLSLGLLLIYIFTSYFMFFQKESYLHGIYKKLNNSLEFIER